MLGLVGESIAFKFGTLLQLKKELQYTKITKSGFLMSAVSGLDSCLFTYVALNRISLGQDTFSPTGNTSFGQAVR